MKLPAVYKYCNGSSDEEDPCLRASLACMTHFYHEQYIYVSGRKMKDPVDPRDGHRLQGEHWVLEPLFPPEEFKYSVDFPQRFRRVSPDELCDFIQSYSCHMHEKMLAKVRPLLEAIDSV